MAVRLKHIAMIVAAASLSGCGSFFDDLNAAAAYDAQWRAENPQPADTDYVQACQTYGCPSNQPAQNQNSGDTRPSGCATATPDGVYHTGGTACPQ